LGDLAFGRAGIVTAPVRMGKVMSRSR
jgi:hypothetical protein